MPESTKPAPAASSKKSSNWPGDPERIAICEGLESGGDGTLQIGEASRQDALDRQSRAERRDQRVDATISDEEAVNRPHEHANHQADDDRWRDHRRIRLHYVGGKHGYDADQRGNRKINRTDRE